MALCVRIANQGINLYFYCRKILLNNIKSKNIRTNNPDENNYAS